MPVTLPCAQCPHPESVKGIFRFFYGPTFVLPCTVTYPQTLTPRNTQTSPTPPLPPSLPAYVEQVHVFLKNN